MIGVILYIDGEFSYTRTLADVNIFACFRWTVNLCLETVNTMFYGTSAFTSADLVEGDTLSVCAYFCYFFMIAYKYRQSKAVADRIVSRLWCAASI